MTLVHELNRGHVWHFLGCAMMLMAAYRLGGAWLHVAWFSVGLMSGMRLLAYTIARGWNGVFSVSDRTGPSQ